MSQRIAMNSRTLQENFPEVYREFFSKCEIVTSAPRSFFWFGDNVTRYGEIGVRQKLPLRAYVGLEPVGDGKISFEDSLFFVPSDQQFRRLLRRTPRLREISELLEVFSVTQRIPLGYRIHVLNELPIGSGLGSWAPAAAALAAALFLKAGRLSQHDLLSWQEAPANKLTGTRGSVFDDVFRLAWKIESLYEGDPSPGCGIFTAMVSSGSPIIFATERRDSHASLAELSKLESALYWGTRLHEFFNLQHVEHWPVDFGLLYTGSTISTEYAVRTGRDLRLALKDVSSSMNAAMGTVVPENLRSRLCFTERSLRGGNGLWEAYLATLEATTLQGLVAFRQLFNQGYTERAVAELFHAINVENGSLEVFNVSSPSIELMRHYLERAAVREEVPIASKVTGAGRGGDVLFVTPLYAFEHAMDSIIKKLREKVARGIWLDYASWIDGVEERGLIIEQDLSSGYTSPLISSGVAIVRSWKEGTVTTQAMNLERLEQLRSGFDLFFDPLERMIYLRGTSLTSKELHSRKATTAVLQVLLKNLGKSVSSQQLPASSYLDRTTMQGKIVGPLVKIIKQKTGKRLPLTISGGLRKNFSLKLSVDGFSIGLLEKKL